MKNALFAIFPAVLLLSFFSFPIHSFAQTDDEESLEYLLDDGNGNQMFLIKVDLMRYLDGNFSLSSEYRTKNLGIEFSYGLQRKPIFRQIRGSFWENLQYYPHRSRPNSITGGNVLQAGLRGYSLFGAYMDFEGDYGLIYVKRNLFKMASGDSYQTIEYCFGGGAEFVSDGGFVFDINFAAGFRQSIGWEGGGSISYNISLLFGYRIF